MGAFREFFTELWNNYIKKPIDGVIEKIPSIEDLKESFEEKIAVPVQKLIEPITKVKDSIGEFKDSLDDKVTNPLTEIKNQFEEKVNKPLQDIINQFNEAIYGINAWWWNFNIGKQVTVEDLEAYWDSLPDTVKNNPSVRKVYEGRHKELELVGKGSPLDPITSWLATQLANGVWMITNQALPKIEAWMDKFAERYKLRKEELDAMKELARSGEFGLNAVVSFMLGVTLYPSIMSVANPYWRLMEQETEKNAHSGLLDMHTLITAWWRNVIDEGKVDDTLLREGYDEEEIKAIKEALQFYPSPTDFIRFATRDVFREDIVEKYGYDSEWDKIESGIKEYVEKAGIDLEVLKWYWRAHWVLPSPQMAFEMLHRGIITQDDIRELLRISDYAPNWIEKLINISYSPITRVDLRRLYQIGVIDEERLLKGYKELGYSDEDAKLMVEWTKIEYTQKDKDLTKTEILRNYRIGQCTREEAKNMLKDLGYDENEAEWILLYEDYKLYVEDIEAEAETIVYELSEGNISYEETIDKLGELNMPERVKLRYLNKAKREVRKTTKRPSTDDLKRWFKMGIIDEKAFKEEMSKNKWHSKYIDNFIKEVKAKK